MSQLFFHLFSPGVGEAVGQVPEIAHVVEEPDLVDLLHLLPHESKDPEDDDAFDGRWEGAAFLGVPVVNQVGQEVHVKSIAKKLELTEFFILDIFFAQSEPLLPKSTQLGIHFLVFLSQHTVNNAPSRGT